MMKRILAFAVALVGLAAAPALADDDPNGYAPGSNLMTVNSPCPGETFTANGTTNMAPGSKVALSLDGAGVGEATVDEAGKFTFQGTAPAEAGDHPLVATGSDGTTISANLAVLECEDAPPTSQASSGDDGALPKTGSDTTMTLLRIGLALAALGGILMAMSARRRRRHRHA